LWISFQFEKVNKIIIFFYIIISITYNFENSFCTRSIENYDKPISVYILTSYADLAAAYGSLNIVNEDDLKLAAQKQEEYLKAQTTAKTATITDVQEKRANRDNG